jgi:hypothetical protein
MFCQSARKNNVSDGFESNELSKVWSTKKFLPGAVEIQSTYVRSGKFAAKITLHQGDQIDDEKGTILERAELMESEDLCSFEGSDYSYSFSIFLPQDFPVVPIRLVLAQWKQSCQSGKCNPGNPVIALRYESGEFQITLQTGPEKTTLFTQKEDIRNKWMDFRFQIRFRRTADGYLKAWLNDQEIVDFKGITSYSQTYGYPDPGRFYFKIGLYRDQMVQPMTIYVDEYKKHQISE